MEDIKLVTHLLPDTHEEEQQVLFLPYSAVVGDQLLTSANPLGEYELTLVCKGDGNDQMSLQGSKASVSAW